MCSLYYDEEPTAEVSRKMLQAIEDQAQNLPSHMLSNLLSRMVETGINLLNNDMKDSRYRIVGLVVLDCLLDVNDEIMAERRIEIANQLRKVLENDKQNIETTGNVLRKAADSIGHLARVASTTEIELLQEIFLTNALKWLSSQRLDSQKFSGSLIIAQLAKNSPALIYMKRKVYFTCIWDIVFDRNSLVREAASESLDAVIALVSQRESTDEYTRLCLHQVEIGFNSTAAEKVHGALLIFNSLLASGVIPPEELLNTIRNVGMRLQDLIWDVLQRKDHRETLIKHKVLILIPKLAALSPVTFMQRNQYTAPVNFLSYSVRHLLDVIYAHRDRALAYVAVGNLLVVMSPALKGVNGIIDDVFAAIKEGFKEPFCIEALQCLSVAVSSSSSGQGHVNTELVNSVFQGGLTPELIKSLKAIVKVSPSIRGQVQSRLRSHITSILINHNVGPNISSRRAASNAALRRAMSTSTPPAPSLLGGFFSSSKSSTAAGSKRAGGQSGGSTPMPQEYSTDDELVLALQVLASFDFLPNQFRNSPTSLARENSLVSMTSLDTISDKNESEMLLRVVRDGVVRYLDDPKPAIRDAAAVTCAIVLNKVVDAVGECSGDGGKYLIQVMDRLLMLGVGDENEDIRVHVFLSLPPPLDHVISNSENVHCLIEAMNDESFDVRSAAMSVLARVAHYDTVHVMPLVRLMLSKLMRQLHNSKDISLRQESVQLLQAMVRGTNVLIVPYVRHIMEPLLALLGDPSSAIVSAAVSTIGELAHVSPEDVAVHLNQLFPMLLQALNDQSSVVKQEVCVVALGKVVSSLNIVSTPYAKYPTLFESLVRAIQRTDVAASALRMQSMKTVGLLGSVDADMYQRTLRAVGGISVLSAQGDFEEDADVHKRSKEEKAHSDDEEDDQLVSLDKYYLSVVIGALMNILRDATLATHHQTAATVTMRVVRILGFQSDNLLDTVISGFLFRFYNSEFGSTLQETLFDHMITMVYVVGREITSHLTALVKLTTDFFHVHLAHCLAMVEALCWIILPQDFNGVIREVLPCMVQVIRNELLQDRDELISTRTEVSSQTNDHAIVGMVGKSSSLPKSSEVFTALANISSSLGEYRRQLVPVILRVVEQTGVRAETRREALCTVMHLALASADLNEFASRIIHPILRLLSGSEPVLLACALTSLSCMVCRLKTYYLPFVVPAKRVISQMVNQRESTMSKLPHLDEYESLVSLLLKQRPLPAGPADVSRIMIKSSSSISKRLEKCKNVQTSLRVDLKALDVAWTLAGRTTASDLIEWMRRLSIELIRQSPSPILRPCAVLAKLYQPLAHELFNAAFVSIWDEIFSHCETASGEDNPLTNGLETTLKSPQIPGHIRQSLLNLAEFMDMQDKRLPLDIQLLAKQAEAANMFAKCLHYREIEFNSKNIKPSSECIEALITVNTQLGMREAASGVLTFVGIHHAHIKIEPYWLEKLARWQDAHKSYAQLCLEWRRQYGQDAPSLHDQWMESELGILRCLHALGCFEELCDGAKALSIHVHAVEGQVDNHDVWMTEVQRLGANAAWMLGQWDDMENFVDSGSIRKRHDIQLENDGTFYEAVLAVHQCDYIKASKLVAETREAVASSISTMLSESYSRAYRSIVTMQVLSEIEELVDYKVYEQGALSSAGMVLNSVDVTHALTLYPGLNEGEVSEVLYNIRDKKRTLLQKWQRRLKCAPREVDVYRLILVRTTHRLKVCCRLTPYFPYIGCTHLASHSSGRP